MKKTNDDSNFIEPSFIQAYDLYLKYFSAVDQMPKNVMYSTTSRRFDKYSYIKDKIERETKQIQVVENLGLEVCWNEPRMYRSDSKEDRQIHFRITPLVYNTYKNLNDYKYNTVTWSEL